MKRNTSKMIVIAVLFLLFGYIFGYMIGSAQVLNLCIKTGERILDIKLNAEAMEVITTRFPEILSLLNHDAPIFVDTGN